MLKSALLANAAFSIITGAVSLFAAAPLSAWMGIADPLWLQLLGPGLFGFSGLLIWTATRPTIDVTLARTISFADYGWVAGTALLLLAAPSAMGPNGKVLAIAIAVCVGALGTAQLAGIARETKAVAAR